MLAPASQILLSYSDEFSQLILNDNLVALLLTEEVISRNTQEMIKRRGYSLDGPPFRAICRKVANEPQKLELLADVLLKSAGTVPLGNRLKKDYCKSLIDIIIIMIINNKVIVFLSHFQQKHQKLLH